MDDEEQGNRGWGQAIRNHSGVIGGIFGLIAWFVLLWKMFGDVL